jgi:hypothetical protein
MVPMALSSSIPISEADMTWEFVARRLFEDENSTATAISTPAGESICCLLEPGPRDRLKAASYPLTLNPMGWYSGDEQVAKAHDPLGYRGAVSIGKDVIILPSSTHISAKSVIAAWHVVKSGERYIVPPDGAFDGKNHGDAFAWLLHNLYLAIDTGGASVRIMDIAK